MVLNFNAPKFPAGSKEAIPCWVTLVRSLGFIRSKKSKSDTVRVTPNAGSNLEIRFT